MSIPNEYTIRYELTSPKGIETDTAASVIGDDMSLGDRIRAERERRDWSQADLGRRVGVSQVTIAKIETGVTTKSKYLPDIMAALSIPYTGVVSEEPPEASAVDVAIHRREMPLDIPVKGVAVGGDDADFSFNGAVSEYVRRPPGLTKMNGVYAVHVVSDSMSPRYYPSDLLYVSSMRAAAIGDFVIVELHGADGEPGKGYIKRLARRSASKIVLSQFNPPCEIEIDATQVRAIHRVFTNNELFGV